MGARGNLFGLGVWGGTAEGSERCKRVVVKIMVPFWVPIIIRHLLFRYPKRDLNFDNYPNGSRATGGRRRTVATVKGCQPTWSAHRFPRSRPPSSRHFHP